MVDIREGQKVALNVLAAFEKPERFDNDLLSVKAMDSFITITIHSAKLTMKWAGTQKLAETYDQLPV